MMCLVGVILGVMAIISFCVYLCLVNSSALGEAWHHTIQKRQKN